MRGEAENKSQSLSEREIESKKGLPYTSLNFLISFFLPEKDPISTRLWPNVLVKEGGS
jgi:hypothetical protein